ncbi:hypothetical protein JTE90_016396 [Oedothorax gibbosus]|uniref:Uncharacterized protein n=1 Tax=Oedothorax gibbosus TaxID=931172 RepID=A0AAV6TFR9_9ARAC|nr:hypothetical protein JTE90_016396 [Oedothorax gibbosus]
MFNCCSPGTLPPASVLKLSLEYFCYSPHQEKICTVRLQRAHARHLQRTHRDPPTHCGVNLHEGSSAVAAR